MKRIKTICSRNCFARASYCVTAIDEEDIADNRGDSDDDAIEDVVEAVGIGADATNVPLGIGKSLLGESGNIIQGFTRTGTVIGAIAGGVPAAYNLLSGNGTVSDGIAVGLALGGVALEFFGVGEVWDAVGITVSVGTIGFDIYNAIGK